MLPPIPLAFGPLFTSVRKPRGLPFLNLISQPLEPGSDQKQPGANFWKAG